MTVVVLWTWNSGESNPRPLGRESDALTITPPYTLAQYFSNSPTRTTSVLLTIQQYRHAHYATPGWGRAGQLSPPVIWRTKHAAPPPQQRGNNVIIANPQPPMMNHRWYRELWQAHSYNFPRKYKHADGYAFYTKPQIHSCWINQDTVLS